MINAEGKGVVGLTVEARAIIGETIGILRAMGGPEAFMTLDRGVKLLLLDQAGRLDYVLSKDLEAKPAPKLSAKEQFLQNN